MGSDAGSDAIARSETVDSRPDRKIIRREQTIFRSLVRLYPGPFIPQILANFVLDGQTNKGSPNLPTKTIT